MARLLRLVIAIAVVTPAFVSMGGPAVACSCAPQSVQKILANADAVVAGHVVGEQPIDVLDTESILTVDGVYKGKVDASIVLSASIGLGGADSCAVLYPVGSKVDPLVLDRLDNGTYQIAPCTFLSRAQVVKVLGSARPRPAASATPGASTSFLPSAVSRAGLSWLAVLGGLALAIAAIALILRKSGRRKRASRPSVFEELQASIREDRR